MPEDGHAQCVHHRSKIPQSIYARQLPKIGISKKPPKNRNSVFSTIECIVHKFKHFCSHQKSDKRLFYQNSSTCYFCLFVCFLKKTLNFHFLKSLFSAIASMHLAYMAFYIAPKACCILSCQWGLSSGTRTQSFAQFGTNTNSSLALIGL